ncbi:MAG: alpha-mannosidase [Clostridia bacterium]|nr:alpha-mannosidase [Clostridia bacterium]
MDKTIKLIGNAHLDPIWLWRWQEGCGEVLQTFRSALDRLKEYNCFVFTCSSAAYYKWVEDIDPQMFEEIRVMIKKGRWVPVNGWWVQPDCNMPSGESFARQALYSQLYYYEKFGITCKTGYNVDSFGHNAMMPQLLNKGGMTNYVFQRPDISENSEIPENLFWWDSPDGSRVLTYRTPTGYVAHGKEDIDYKLEILNQRAEETGHGMMMFYGVGNHGGGPTRGDIEYLKANLERDGFNDLEFSSPDGYFEDVLNELIDLPTWDDELQHHASGCYSATSLVKALNRKAENALAAAEKWDTISSIVAESKSGTKEFESAWQKVCFNQFHDIMCGCSIMEAYEDVKESEGYALNIASEKYNNAVLRIARKIDTWIEGVSDPVFEERHHTGSDNGFPRPVVVFNPHSYDVELPVRVHHPSKADTDSEGNQVLFQNVRSSRSNDSHLDTLFVAKVPSMGYATFWLEVDREAYAEKEIGAEQNFLMENEFMSVEFDGQTGYIKSLVDKATGVNLADDNFLAIPTVIDDHKTDTWAHKVFKFNEIKGLMELVEIQRVESGALRSVIRTKHKFNDSYLTQDFILAKGQKTLKVECKAMWQERFTMLKFAFPTGGKDAISTYEIPCGFIKRPCNGEEEPALNWADLTVTKDGKRVGLSVMSDSKYSYDCPGAELRLTALRNVIFADHYSDRPAADFNFTDEGLNRFSYGVYLHGGEAECSDVVKEAHLFNNNVVAVPESYHKGELPQKDSFFYTNLDNVVVTALKRCEDGSGDLIIRLYETKGIEDSKGYVMSKLFDNGFWYDIKKHEIKTFRIDRDTNVREVNFLEGIIEN